MPLVQLEVFDESLKVFKLWKLVIKKTSNDFDI